MATIHRATISPTKPELLAKVLGGPTEILGTYRFDDPDGAVGVEAFVVARDGAVRHVVFTYRGAPLGGADDHLVSTMEHSTLGRRWVYSGLGDPVALDCFSRAVLGEQQQALEEVWEDGRQVGVRDPTARLSVVPGTTRGGEALTIATDLEEPLADTAGPRLRAEWAGGSATVAALG